MPNILKTVNSIAASIFVTVSLFSVFIPVNVYAQGGGLLPGKPVIELLHNGKVVSDKSIDVTKVQEYSLTVAVLPVSGYKNQYWKGEIVIFSSTDNTFKNIQWFASEKLVKSQVYEKKFPNFKACTAAPGVYKYRAIYSYDETGQNLSQTELEINFTGKNKASCFGTTTNPNPNSNQTGNNSDPNSNQTGKNDGPTGKDNKDINSGVTAKLEFGLDTELGKFFNPLDDQLTVPGLIVRLINIVLVFSGMISVAFIIYGGLIMVSSAGNESRVTKGKNTLIYAVAGLIVSILSFSIVALIQGVISRV